MKNLNKLLARFVISEKAAFYLTSIVHKSKLIRLSVNRSVSFVCFKELQIRARNAFLCKKIGIEGSKKDELGVGRASEE